MEKEKKTLIKFKSTTPTTTTTKIKSKKTKTELAFERNKLDKITKKRNSHKDRINKFNSYLERLPEHNDIPKIGPG